jgi:hypothetical protein
MLLLPAGWREKENERARVSLKCTSHMRRLGNSISSSQGERCTSEQIKGKKFITKQTETQEIKEEEAKRECAKKRTNRFPVVVYNISYSNTSAKLYLTLDKTFKSRLYYTCRHAGVVV